MQNYTTLKEQRLVNYNLVVIVQGWPDFFAHGPNKRTKNCCGLQKNFLASFSYTWHKFMSFLGVVYYKIVYKTK